MDMDEPQSLPSSARQTLLMLKLTYSQTDHIPETRSSSSTKQQAYTTLASKWCWCTHLDKGLLQQTANPSCLKAKGICSLPVIIAKQWEQLMVTTANNITASPLLQCYCKICKISFITFCGEKKQKNPTLIQSTESGKRVKKNTNEKL